MTTSVGRFQVTIGTPRAMPGKCVVCGTTSGTFIDFGFDLDYYGVVYFCLENCFREAANHLGYYSPEQWEINQKLIKEYATTIKELISQNTELRNGLDSLSRVFNSSTIASLVQTVANGSSNETVQTIDRDAKDTESRSNEQVDERGYNDLQRDDSLDEFLNGI